MEESPRGSCLICGYDKPFAVWRDGADAGVCEECRDNARYPLRDTGRRLMLLEDGRDSLRMENEALRKRNKQLELAAEPAGARILKLARENDALRKRNEKLERVASRLYDIIGCFSYDGAPLVAVEQEGEIVNLPVDRTLAQAIARADEALAELDKEELK